MKKMVNGIVMDMTANEIAAKQAEELAWTNGAFDRAIAEVRNKRNNLLAETDWHANSDVTMSAAMTTYRQSLRDITDNVDDLDAVNAITWPTKPGA